MSLLRVQYDLIRGSRQALFQYMETMPPGLLTERQAYLGNRSLASILTHVANNYLYWMDQVAREETPNYFQEASIQHMVDARRQFAVVDQRVYRFLEHYTSLEDLPRMMQVPHLKTQGHFRPLDIFTHVTTHEFHHKGQLCSAGRLLGYIPPDTDIIRFQ